ncbi:Phage PhiH1 repressor protein, partial [Ehrlichia ruminantium]
INTNFQILYLLHEYHKNTTSNLQYVRNRNTMYLFTNKYHTLIYKKQYKSS